MMFSKLESENKTNKILTIIFHSIVKPVNEGHLQERQILVFIDKWSLFGDFFVLFHQLKNVMRVWPLLIGWSLLGRWPLTQV